MKKFLTLSLVVLMLVSMLSICVLAERDPIISPEEITPPSSEPGEPSPQTGVSGSLVLIGTIAAVVFCGAVATVVVMKKKAA